MTRFKPEIYMLAAVRIAHLGNDPDVTTLSLSSVLWNALDLTFYFSFIYFSFDFIFLFLFLFLFILGR